MQGYAAEAETVRNAWNPKDRATAMAAISERMINDIFAIGNAVACRDRLQQYRRAGIQAPMVMPIRCMRILRSGSDAVSRP